MNLYGSPIDDYAPIKPLMGLQSLKLGSLYAPFPGLDFLADWDGLKIVELISTTPLDLAPLRRCTGLERLGISCSQHKVELTNLSALRGCRDLAHVFLLNSQSDEYTTVAGWTALTFAQIVEPICRPSKCLEIQRHSNTSASAARPSQTSRPYRGCQSFSISTLVKQTFAI